MTILALAAIAAVPLFMLARRGELEGNPERFVGVVVAFLLVECLFYPAQSDVPVGLFRIPVAGGDLRTHDYLVVVGLLARASVRRLPRWIERTGVVWFLSFVWLAVATVRGLAVGHSTNVVLFSASSLVGLFGGLLLVAGCEPGRLARLLRRPFVVPLGALVMLMWINQTADPPRTYFGTGFGVISVDTASVFVALGTFVVLVEWSSRRRNVWALLAAVPLLATPFAIEQRATLVHLGGTVLVVGWAMTRPEWRSRLRVPRMQLMWGFLCAVAVLMIVLMVQLRSADGELPFASYYEGTFASEGQQLSAQARRESFSLGIDEWSSAWLYGYGLGHTYEIIRPYGTGIEQPATFDNVPLDLLVRSGVVGFVLFVSAFVMTLRDGLVVWKRHPDNTAATLALAAVAVLVGLGLKSGFESILEKGKLALVIGLSVGVISACVRSRGRSPQQTSSTSRSDSQGAIPWT